MVIIKAKGEYYRRELERLEKEKNLTDSEKKEVINRKTKLKTIEKDIVKNFRSIFNKGNIHGSYIRSILSYLIHYRNLTSKESLSS